MYCYSTKQPWAHAIMYLMKDIENRVWHVPRRFHGQRVLLHTGKSTSEFDEDTFDSIENIVGHSIPHHMAEYPFGAIVGSVILVDSSRQNRWNSKWFCGPIGWMQRDPQPLSEPIPCKGQRGFFVPKDYPTIEAEERCRELVKKLER